MSLHTGSRTSGSSLDDLGHEDYLYPPDPELDLVPVKPKLLRRFYEPLVLLHVLDPNRGSRIPRSISNGDCEDELRRSFIDSVAYICDFKKGGDTCTAAAMQKEPACVTICLAANTNIKEKTICFLRGVLNGLVAISASNRTRTEDSLAVRIIDFNKKRLQAYQAFVRPPLSECLKKLEQKCDGECYPYGCHHVKLDGMPAGSSRTGNRLLTEDRFRDARRHSRDPYLAGGIYEADQQQS